MSRHEVDVVEDSTGGASIGLWCDTCGTRFPTQSALAAHLVNAYHGFQCLRCGALFALRRQMEGHDCHGSSEADESLLSLMRMTAHAGHCTLR